MSALECDAAMNPAQRVAETAVEAALATLLPPLKHELLLTACLREGREAANAWSEFVAAVGDAKNYFEGNNTGLKGLLPFVETSLAANNIDAGKAFHTYARVALVREELRGRIVAGILEDLVAAADAQGIRFLLMKGAAVGATAYPQPSARHVHAIDLLIDPQGWHQARTLLAQLRFDELPRGPGADHHQDFKHWTGLALGLHNKPFFLPYFAMPMALIESRARTIEVQGGRAIRVMSPEDSLVHVSGHAVYARSRSNLRWVCDVVCLLKRYPNLDWQRVVDTAVMAGLAPVLLNQLRWINRRLFPIPRRWLKELHSRSRATLFDSSECFYASVLHTTQSRRKALRAFGAEWRTQLGFLRFTICPSLRYMRWKHNVDSNWRVAVHYADRPRRFALRLAQVGGMT